MGVGEEQVEYDFSCTILNYHISNTVVVNILKKCVQNPSGVYITYFVWLTIHC